METSQTTDYTGYKECGHPEYRATEAGPQPNDDCGCETQIETIDQARDSYDAAWKALGAAKDAVLAAQAAAGKAERAWGDASVTLQRFEADADAARRAAVTCPRCPHESDAS